MSNSSLADAKFCPPPFLPLSEFPYVAGQQDGRFCGPSPLNAMVQCCLPCPLTQWVYPDNFDIISQAAGWVGVGSIVCCGILLLSLAVLPAQVTSRHYLTICLIAAVFFLELAFVIPLGSKPDQCFDRITPNNLQSDLSCGFSGAFVLGGGFAAVVWVFVRSLSVHLQICWKIVPSTTFFYLSQLGAWGITAVFLALSLTLSGVSYRLGSTCHINHENSVGTFWGPLVALAAISLILQLATFAYCIKVYLQVANGPKGLPSTSGSSTVYTNASGSNRSAIVKRATYRRVRKVIALQWRGMTVVLIVIVSAVYLATVFLMLDSDVTKVDQRFDLILPWVTCLVENKGDKNVCLSLTRPFILKEQVVLPVLYLVSIIGFWGLFFLGKWEMVGGWADLLSSPFRRGSSSRNSSLSIRPQSQESFSTRMRGTPQHLHIVKGERGLSVANKGNENLSYGIELMRATSSPASNAPSDTYLTGKGLESAYSNSQSQQTYESNFTNSSSTNNPIYGQPDWSLTAPERVWPGPQTAPPQFPRSPAHGARGSFNFSRPSTAQGPTGRAPPPSMASAATNSTTTGNMNANTGITTSSGATISAPTNVVHSPSAFSQGLDVGRADSLASAGWDMHNLAAAIDYDDTVPLSPAPAPAAAKEEKAWTPPAHGDSAPDADHLPSIPVNLRPRLRPDSRASSTYSFSIVAGYAARNPTPNSASRSITNSPVPNASSAERPSAGMAWDPASSFAGPTTTSTSTTTTTPAASVMPMPGYGPSRHHQPSRSTSSSPALGRSANTGHVRWD